MFNNHEIIHYIDKYRIEHKIPIYKLTKGIMSTRNYSRLLSNETHLSFEDYASFLKRLRIPVFEFSMYLYNCRFFETIHENNFFGAVDNKQYKTAYDIIQPYLPESRWNSIYAKKTMPISLKIVEYHLNKCNKQDLLSSLREIIQLDSLIKHSIFNIDDFEAIFLFSSYCSSKEKQIIIDLLVEIIVDQKKKILSASVEYTTSRMHRLAVELITSLDFVDNQNLYSLNRIAYIALEYQSRAKMYLEDLYILQCLYHFFNKNNMMSNAILTEYVLSVLGSQEDDMIVSLKNILSSSEIEYILSSIQDSTFKKTNLIEEMMSYEFIK